MEVVTDNYKQTEVGLIPEDWEVRELGELINFIGGSQPPLSTFIPVQKEGYIRLLQIRDYKTDKYKTYIPIQFARKFCNTDDIMIGRYGPPIFQILRGLEGAYNVALIKAVPLKGINKNYAYHFLKQNILFDFVEKLSQRSSGQTGVDLQQLKVYPVKLPSIAEQTAIANALSDTDVLISSLEKLITKKRNIKQGAMQELLRPKEGWEVKKLGEIILSTQLGGNYQNTENFTNFPLIKMGNIQRGYISTNKIEYITDNYVNDYDKLNFGDLLFNTRNTLELVGKVAIWRNELPCAYFNSNLMRLKFKPSNVSSTFFINNLFNTKNLISKLRDIATGTTSVAAIYTRDLLQIDIDLPSLEEQLRIATILTEMDSEITALETKLAKYKDLKQGMMQNLLTGKIRLV